MPGLHNIFYFVMTDVGMFNCFRPNLFEEFVEWVEHNLFEAIVLFYWLILILVSVFSLWTESANDIHNICPVSHVWGDLLFQTCISAYGLCCLTFIKRGDHDIVSTKGSRIHMLDKFNIWISLFAMMTNIILTWETCNDRVSHTSTYSLACDHFFAIFILFVTSVFMVLHKNEIAKSLHIINGGLTQQSPRYQYQTISPQEVTA
jgi:TRAP-type uncharacterized transport system fused permease subunit